MKDERENTHVDEWFIGDEGWNYVYMSNNTCDKTACVMKRTPTPYPSYESFPETPVELNRQLCKYSEEGDDDTCCYWLAQMGRNVQMLYEKLLFK